MKLSFEAVLVGIIAAGIYLFGVFMAPEAKPQFTTEQCISQPSGREHKHYAEVALPDGTKAVADKASYHEWVTVCERSEWR